ncbi:MAG: hypothetical protein Ct9H300mP11_12460 [Chloroflexota bacterium]|nr:MAG: hypothetical protein Ct9H300mP11_12460 [Chloroflexota bacterium]
MAHLGRAPHSVAEFENYLEQLQHYLSGNEVEFEDGSDLGSLGLADHSNSSLISWISRIEPKVPVDVAATGPRVIAAAARHADRISLNVGADIERVKWGMDVARDARAKAGIAGDIPFTAYISLVVHDDPEEAMRIGAGQVSLFARFSAMYGKSSVLHLNRNGKYLKEFTEHMTCNNMAEVKGPKNLLSLENLHVTSVFSVLRHIAWTGCQN